MLTLLAAIVCAACGSIFVYLPSNSMYDRSAQVVTRANLERWDTQNEVFVGVAISGGGSRAANFSAAVLEELEKHGFLNYLTAISSVSGGSLTSTYYALRRNDPLWTWSKFYEKLGADFESMFLLRYMLPWNLLATGLTNYNRSNLMASVR
jgi:predicted acylesterase/phospholipase RssA